MRITVIVMVVVAFMLIFAMSACKKKKVVEKPMPMTQISVNRDNVLVWLDVTRNDTQRAFDSLDTNRKQIGVLSPAMYLLKDGKVILNEKIGPNTVSDMKYACEKNEPKVKIRPLFGNVDQVGAHGDEALKILENPALQKNAIAAIVKVVADPNYIGVDIDWEEIPVDKIHLLADFLVKLAPPIHKAGKTLSVVLEAWNVRNEWRQIAEVVDYVEFMAYPEHHPGTGPGPIASLSWATRNLEMALKVVPRAKLVFCMPFFGYIWNVFGPIDVKWSEVMSKPRNSTVVVYKRDMEGNPNFQFRNGEGWYEDAYSINQKMLMAKKYRIGQFGFWQIGGEDPGVWKSLN